MFGSDPFRAYPSIATVLNQIQLGAVYPAAIAAGAEAARMCMIRLHAANLPEEIHLDANAFYIPVGSREYNRMIATIAMYAHDNGLADLEDSIAHLETLVYDFADYFHVAHIHIHSDCLPAVRRYIDDILHRYGCADAIPDNGSCTITYAVPDNIRRLLDMFVRDNFPAAGISVAW